MDTTETPQAAPQNTSSPTAPAGGPPTSEMYFNGAATPPTAAPQTQTPMVFDAEPVKAPEPMTFDAEPVKAPQPGVQASSIPDSLHILDDNGIDAGDSALTRVGKGAKTFGKIVNAVGAGVGDSVLGTMNGAADLLGIPHGVLEHAQRQLEADNSENPTLNAVGYGGETMMEFLAGDAALKGLSLADRLAKSGQIAKVLENSPRIMRALKMGAASIKAGGMLTEAERALIQEYPILSRLLGAGVMAGRAGVVAGTETAAKTEGTLGHRAAEGVKSGALTAATAGVVGGATGVVGGVLGKAAAAADTVGEMGNIAKNAPTKQAITDHLTNAVEGTQAGERASVLNNVERATNSVNATHQAQIADALKTGSDADVSRAVSQKAVQDLADQAPESQSITEFAQKAAKQANTEMHAKYVAKGDKLVELTDGSTVPYENSPIHQAAQEIVGEENPNAGPLDSAIRKGRPGSPDVNDMLDRLNSLGGPEEVEEAAPEKWVDANGVEHIEPAKPAGNDLTKDTTPNTDLTMQHLLDSYKSLGEKSRKVGWATSTDLSDQDIYYRLKKGILDTISQLAEESGNPDAVGMAEEMNSAYKNEVALFQNQDVKSILKGNLNNVATRLVAGQTSLGDINTVHKVLGDKGFADLGTQSLKRMAADVTDQNGAINYKALLTKLSRINPTIRNAMFGQANADSLLGALNNISKTTEDIGNAAKSAADAETNLATNLKGIGDTAAGRTKQINDTIAHVLGDDGDIQGLMKDPARLKSLQTMLGPSGMKTLGRMVMDNQIAQASMVLKNGAYVPTNFDADKVLNWWNGFKDSPETINALFHTDNASAQAYTKAMSELQHVSSVKKLIKYGVLPVTFSGAGTVFGGWGALVGAMLAGGTEATFGSVRNILDDLANRPQLWTMVKNVAKVGPVAEKVVKSPITRAGGYGAVMGATHDSLGGTPSQSSKQPNDVEMAPAAAPPSPQPTYDSGPLAGKPVPGLLRQGNIDVNHRPQVKNDDGSSSTIFSVTVPVNRDGSVWHGDYDKAPSYALVPSIANGRFLTKNGKMPAEGDKKAQQSLADAATDHYAKTREHLGIFRSSDEAEQYTKVSHAYGNDGTARKVFTPSHNPTL